MSNNLLYIHVDRQYSFENVFFADPAFQDTSGSAPHFVLATGGNDNLVKLWDVFTASGIIIYHVFFSSAICYKYFHKFTIP